MDMPEARLDLDELNEFFDRLFPKGFAGADVRAKLFPDGYEQSPLFALFHPSPQQQYDEAVAMHANLARLKRPDDDSPEPPAPTREEFDEESDREPMQLDEEIARLVGMALWDLFSDNHEVTAADGRQIDLGSFRAGGGFLADHLNRQLEKGLLTVHGLAERQAELDEQLQKMMPSGSGSEMFLKMMREEQTGPFRYTDFYMGSHMVSGRADLTPIYALIFTRLRALDCDWKYVFPRLGLVDFRPMKKALDEQKRAESGEAEWEGYDPAAAFEEQEEETEKDREVSEMREKLDEGYRESVEAAQDQPPPTVVSAYEKVYGELPEGWPPEAGG